MSDSKELRSLRAMAWQRAKGEINAMLETYWSDKEYVEVQKEVDIFKKKIDQYM